MVLDQIPQRVFWKDRNSRYLGCNKAFAADAGLDSPATILGKTDQDLNWGPEAELFFADDQAVMESGNPKRNFTEAVVRPDGTRNSYDQ